VKTEQQYEREARVSRSVRWLTLAFLLAAGLIAALIVEVLG